MDIHGRLHTHAFGDTKGGQDCVESFRETLHVDIQCSAWKTSPLRLTRRVVRQKMSCPDNSGGLRTLKPILRIRLWSRFLRLERERYGSSAGDASCQAKVESLQDPSSTNLYMGGYVERYLYVAKFWNNHRYRVMNLYG